MSASGNGDPAFGDAWVYESIVGAVPGLDVSGWPAVAIQLVCFEGAALALAAIYGTWDALLPGTVAILVASTGSIEMLRIASTVRRTDAPPAYRQLLFGSSIEVVLAVLAFVALVTYLFVVDPRGAAEPLLAALLGQTPPAPVVAVMLLVLWDLCYRIGTGWWASVAALWRSLRCELTPATARTLQRADLETMAFAWLQLALAPFVRDHPVLLAAVVGHVAAVTLVTTASILALQRTAGESRPTTT